MTQARPGTSGRRLAWLALLLVIIAALAVVISPVWLIQPFRAQTERGLAISYLLRRWSPLVTVTTLVIAFALVVWLWRGSRRVITKVTLIVLLVPAVAAAWFAKQNHFEWLFNPLKHSAYVKTSEASFVGEQD